MKSISRPLSSPMYRPIRARMALGLSAALCLILAACAKDAGSKEPKGAENAPSTAPHKGMGENPLGEGVARPDMPGNTQPGEGSDKSYTITLDTPQSVAQGSEGVVKVNVVPNTGWKMNKDFPTRLQVVAPEGVTLVKDKQGIGDAEKFEDKGAVFAVKFKADSAGAKSFQADFKFAVCTDATCDPKKQTLAWVVDVK